MNGRVLATATALLAASLIAAIGLSTFLLGDTGIRADFTARNLAPQTGHIFGTDAMGRDMLARSLHALGFSLQLGIFASGISVVIATLMALASGLGRWVDQVARLVTDAMLSMPHLVLLILLCFTLGGGTTAIIIAIAISHWPRLTRILRAELLQVQAAPYVETSAALGRSRFHIVLRHILPHLIPQIMVGFLLMFPHAILHEAGLTFLGFGLEPSRPAIGVILSEAMRHISSGRWWLALFPGAMLVIMVLALEALGSAVRRLSNPRERQC